MMTLNNQASDPPPTCTRCERLAIFRKKNQELYPDFFNAPVPSFGDMSGRFLIVGLAPGLKGANRTGRPFTGDYAGDLLYETLERFGFSNGKYDVRVDDGLKLQDCLITNAVRCLPPENKPKGEEIRQCRPYLIDLLAAMPNLKVVLALGRVAHESFISSLDLKRSAYPFGHGARYSVRDDLTFFDSYHCSRYNTNTRRLTPQMFYDVFSQIRRLLDTPERMQN